MMFFWSTSDTFSIIDALLKLILVITGSALIICFCHRLTNYKKKSRYRYKNTDGPEQQLASANPYYYGQNPALHSQQPLPSHLFGAPYDPYNRPLTYQYLSSPVTAATEAALAGHSLATFEVAPSPAALVANPVYSATPCYLVPAASEPPTPEGDQCPSYEEAVAAAARLQADSQDGGDEATSDCGDSKSAPIKLVYDFPAYALLFGDANQQLQQQSQHQLMESVQQQADQTLEPSRMAHRPHADGSTSTDDPLDTALGLIESTIKSLAVPHDPKLLNSSFIPSAIANATVDQINDSSMAPQVDLSLALSPTGPIGQGERRSGLIRLPHSHSYQICSNSSECEAPNTICVMDVCVCKPGYYVQSSSCLSFRDLLKDCQNDRQCQAINVDLICDNESNERPVCDCPVGLYFEQETHRCLPCHRSILIHSSSNSSQKNRSIHHETIDLKPNENVAELVYKPNSTNSTDQLLSSRADIKLEEATSGHLLRPCLPLRQIPWMTNSIRPLTRAQEKFNSRTTLTTTNVNLTPTGLYGHSASDPFRIKTPLHVFMGAIMLFTLFTVAWFFLQRMIHDCRAIMKSLRNPDQFGPATSAGDHSTVGTLTNRTSSHHFFDPTSQAVARLISGDSVYGCNQPFANISSGLLQRDLAGVMVQQLAANLTPSSTSNTLVGNSSTRTLSSGLGPNNEHEASLYSFGPTGGSQSRHMAAAAAAQLLLSPNHPAIAILRAAAASVAHNPCSTDYASANLLSSILDPPPKYEEAIAQSTRISYSNPLGEIHDQTNQSSEQGENL